MRVDVIDSLEGLEKLEPEWRELYGRCPRATPFQSPQWLLPWTRYLFQGGEIWAVTLRHEGELIGFAPLFCWGIALQTVSFLGAGVSDYGDVLYSPGREDECVSALWSVLSSRQGRWHFLDLQELRSGSALLEGHDVEKCSVCPVLDLGTYPGSMDHKHRTDLHRAQNRIRKHLDVEFVMAAEESLFGLIEEFFILHAARWGEMDASIQAFHREVAVRFLASGDLRLCVLRIDKVPAAAVYSFRNGQVLYCYLSGFDPAMAKLSPGAVLLNWLIEGELEAGAEAVDFLRNPEAYKYLWGARDRANYTLRVNRESSTEMLQSRHS
jgi:CelD/BcsL family acetyltransferase involved in cellulose biosynthesis